MSYHNTSSASQITTNGKNKRFSSNTQDKTIQKTIKSFNIDFNDIKQVGENRNFTILGDNGAVFSLEVTSPEIIFTDATCDYNNDPTIAHDDDDGEIEVGMLVSGTGVPTGVTSDTAFELSASTTGGSVTNGTLTFTREKKYYNFQTNLFQTAITGLKNISVNGTYTGNILFPKIPSPNKYYANQYDFFLFAESIYNTKHTTYRRATFADGNIDINSSKGSNSNLVQKVIYQTLDVALTLSAVFAPNGAITSTGSDSQSITISRGKSSSKIPFSISTTTGVSNALTIDKQPVSKDIMAFITATVGATPVNIPGEDIYPTVTAADKVVNVSGGTAVDDDPPNVTMDDDFTGLWAVGDRITGNAALDARTQATAVTVTHVDVNVGSGDNPKIFTMSEAVAIADDEELSFSNRRNYRWPISSTTEDVGKIIPGMRQVKAEFFETQPVVKNYLTQITVNEGTAREHKIDDIRVPALETFAKNPTIVRDSVTKVVTETIGAAANPINITFSEQALLTFGDGANAKIFGYGTSEIKRLTGYDVEFSDLRATLTPITTTTTAAVNASTSVPIANRIGIFNNISTVSGIGIDPSVTNPTVVSGAGAVTGAGTIVLSAAQTLEDGTTLAFPGAGSFVNISGNIKVNKAGNKDIGLRFDIERFLTMH